MTQQAFTKSNILRSQRKLRRLHNEFQIKTAAESAAIEINAETFSWEQPSVLAVNKKTAYYFSSLKSKLVSNRLSDNIRFAYRVQMPNRNLVVDQIITLLQENVPFSILKFDVKSFFESIDRDELFSELDYDLGLTTESRSLLYDLFSNPHLPSNGIPRGLPVSSILAELSIRPFDRAIRTLPQVYFYTRFVDDILIFVSSNPAKVRNNVKQASTSFSIPLNEAKEDTQTVECANKKGMIAPPNSKCFPSCRCKPSDAKVLTLTFLGYCFHFYSVPLLTKPADSRIKISLAQTKIQKLKQRMFNSLGNYLKTGDFELLRDRMRFLTGTFTINNSGNGRHLRGGNYYVYPKLTDLTAFESLDKIKATTLFGCRTRLSRALTSSLTASQKRQLARISFVKGFSSKYHYNFGAERVATIRSCFDT